MKHRLPLAALLVVLPVAGAAARHRPPATDRRRGW